MVIELSVGGLITLLGIPTAITAFCSWMLQRRITKREKAQEEREQAREQNEVLIIKGMGAAIALGEATAQAVQRIPDAHCNGVRPEGQARTQGIHDGAERPGALLRRGGTGWSFPRKCWCCIFASP